MRKPKRYVESDRYISQKKYKSYLGNRYGSLKILDFPGYIPRTDSKSHKPAVMVKCDCGAIFITGWYHVKNGHTTTCGCKHLLYYNDPTQGSCNDLMNRYKHSAEERGIKFDLDYKTFRSITSQNCMYCDIEPLQVRYPKNCQAPYYYNGIDRMDNNKGYVSGNVAPCCKICNRAKGTMTLTEWYSYITRFSKTTNACAKKSGKNGEG